MYFSRNSEFVQHGKIFQEEVAAVNLGKYRQLQTQVDDANERADIAENSLAKLRSKNRASTMGPIGLSASASFVNFQSDLAWFICKCFLVPLNSFIQTYLPITYDKSP